LGVARIETGGIDLIRNAKILFTGVEGK